MILKGWIPALGLLVLAATWTGCKHRPPGTYPCVDDEIRVGETLLISLLDIPDPMADKSFLVAGDGTVNLPHLGSIVATNKKFVVFEKEIQRLYIEKKLYRHVTVSVKPGERYYTVGGEVNTKGRTLYLGQTTVLRAIVSCGDFTDFADRRNVAIVRANGTREVMDCVQARKDPRYDRPLCPGDAIFVPRSVL